MGIGYLDGHGARCHPIMGVGTPGLALPVEIARLIAEELASAFHVKKDEDIFAPLWHERAGPAVQDLYHLALTNRFWYQAVSPVLSRHVRIVIESPAPNLVSIALWMQPAIVTSLELRWAWSKSAPPDAGCEHLLALPNLCDVTLARSRHDELTRPILNALLGCRRLRGLTASNLDETDLEAILLALAPQLRRLELEWSALTPDALLAISKDAASLDSLALMNCRLPETSELPFQDPLTSPCGRPLRHFYLRDGSNDDPSEERDICHRFFVDRAHLRSLAISTDEDYVVRAWVRDDNEWPAWSRLESIRFTALRNAVEHLSRLNAPRLHTVTLDARADDLAVLIDHLTHQTYTFRRLVVTSETGQGEYTNLDRKLLARVCRERGLELVFRECAQHQLPGLASALTCCPQDPRPLAWPPASPLHRRPPFKACVLLSVAFRRRSAQSAMCRIACPRSTKEYCGKKKGENGTACVHSLVCSPGGPGLRCLGPALPPAIIEPGPKCC